MMYTIIELWYNQAENMQLSSDGDGMFYEAVCRLLDRYISNSAQDNSQPTCRLGVILGPGNDDSVLIHFHPPLLPASSVRG